MAAAKMFACLFVSSYIHDDAFCLSAFFFFSVVLPHRFIRVSFVSRVSFGSHFEFFPVVFSAFFICLFCFFGLTVLLSVNSPPLPHQDFASLFDAFAHETVATS
jgi:hypothetical protein